MSELPQEVKERLDMCMDLREVVQTIGHYQEQAEEAEELAKMMKAQVRYLQEAVGPRIMLEDGIISTELDTGERVRMKTPVYARIASGKDKDAAQWLRSCGLSGLLKGQITVPLSSNTVEKVEALAEEWEGDFAVKAHPAALSKAVADLEEEGYEIPDCIGIFKKVQIVVTNRRKRS